MKRNLLKTWLLLCALIVGSGTMWAEDKTITLTYSSFGLETSYKVKTATVDGIDFTVNQGYKGNGNTIQMNSSKGSGILYNTTAITGLKSIQVNVASGNKTYTITTGTSEKPTANVQTGTTGGTYNALAGDTYFQLKVSGASYFSSIVITYSDTPAAKVDVTDVTLSQETATLIMEGEPLQLTATVSPNDATDKTVTWTSSNEEVATVSDDGLVTPVATGSCTITATATNGTDDTSDDQTATCTVNVTPNYKNISFVTGTDDSDWTISPTSATAGTEITDSYNGSRNVKSFELLKNQPLTETIATGSGISTFTGDNVSITVSYPGNGNENGAWIYNPNNENGTMTISTTNGRNITSVVLTIALYPHNSGMVSATSGTCTVSNGGGTITVSDVNATSVTLSISDFYVQVSQVEVHDNNLVSTDIAVSNTGNDYTFTMPNYDVEIQVEYVPLPYTVTLGDDNSSLTEAAGGAGVILPSRSDIGSYTFAGWSETNMTEETTEEPVIFEEGEYYPTADITLYPVYTRTGGGGIQNKTASVTISQYASANGWVNSTQYETVTLDANVTAAVSDGGANTGKYYLSNNSWRFYANESAVLSISTTSGELTSITITYTGNKLTYNGNDVTSGTSVSVSGESAQFAVSGSSSNTQVTAISVSYTISSSMTYYTSTPSVSLTTNEGETGEFWATYYNNDYNVKVVSEETQVFKVNLSGSAITMTEIADGIVTKGQGVVLKSNSNSISMTVNASASDDNYDGNSLQGTMTAIANPGNAYVLNKKSAGIGFYKLKAEGTIGANKAYLVYNGTETREFLLSGEATGIDNVSVSNCGNGEVYDLQGRRVSQPTKGLYIVNGKKVVIK